MSGQMPWNGGLQSEAVQRLSESGGLVVLPTKVGYILVATDARGLERKFEAKERSKAKPAVVLCASMGQLRALAEINEEIERLYQDHWDSDVLLGCILPWRSDAWEDRIDADVAELVSDSRRTSCFVIKFGAPAEAVVGELWEKHQKLSFASSANPSGRGNRGVVAGIGARIADAADWIVEADAFVRSIQPDADEFSRHEQGVMVSMVDQAGGLVPEQNGRRSVTPAPVVIRRGLDVEQVMSYLSKNFNSWDYRHGEYY